MRLYKAWTGHEIDLDMVVAIKDASEDLRADRFQLAGEIDASCSFGIAVYFGNSNSYQPLRLDVCYDSGGVPWKPDVTWYDYARGYITPIMWGPGGALYDDLKKFLNGQYAALRAAWQNDISASSRDGQP